MLSEEEKKVINSLKNEYKKLEEEGNILFPLYKQQAKTVLNLITKLQKENENLKKRNEIEEFAKKFTKSLNMLNSEILFNNEKVYKTCETDKLVKEWNNLCDKYIDE